MKKLKLILFILMSTHLGFGQNLSLPSISLTNVDSIDAFIKKTTKTPLEQFRYYLKLRNRAKGQNVSLVPYYSKKTIDAALASDSLRLYCVYAGEHSVILVNHMVLDSSLKYAIIAQNLSYDINDNYVIGRAKVAMGYYYYMNSDIERAKKYYTEAREIFTFIDSIKYVNAVLMKEGIMYRNLEEYEKSYQAYNQVFNNLKPNIRKSFFRNLIVSSYHTKDTSRTRQHIQQYIDLYGEETKLKTFYSDRVFAFKAALDNDRIKELYFLRRMFNHSLKKEDERAFTNTHFYLGNYYQKQGQLDSAMHYYETAYEIVESNKFENLYYRSFSLLVNCAEEAGNYEAALRYKKKESDFLKNVSIRVEHGRAVDNNMRLSLAKKEYELTALRFETKHKSKNLAFLSFFSAISFALLFFTLYFYRKYKAINVDLHEKNEALDKSLDENRTMLQETHHRVKNNLQIIASLLNLQRKYSDDIKLTTALQDGKNRVKSMALIHQLLYQNDKVKNINIKVYVDTLVHSLLGSFQSSNQNVSFINKVAPLQMHEDSVLSLGLIINELVTNAIKYAFDENQKGTITVTLREETDHLLLCVKDNGKGFAEGFHLEDSDSFGYSLIQSLTKKLKGKLSLETNGQTKICITIPDYNKLLV